MIELKSLTFSFGEGNVIEGLSHRFPSTGVVAIMGPSGCGKTTLLRLMAGLIPPSAGALSHSFQKIAVSFQEPRLLPNLTCLENLLLVLPRGENSLRKAQSFLEQVELSEVANEYPSTLSGGMKQRLSLARALAFGGDLLLLDEPFSGLEADLQKRLAPHILAANPTGLTVLITHDPAAAALLGARVLHCHGTPLTALQ